MDGFYVPPLTPTLSRQGEGGRVQGPRGGSAARKDA